MYNVNSNGPREDLCRTPFQMARGQSEQSFDCKYVFCHRILGIKLREANQQQQFNRNVEDIELWLYEVEGHLASDDYGKDLTSVQNLQKKHALLEADVAAHQVTRDIHQEGIPDTNGC